MPRARIKGTEHEVRVTQDLADNWAVEVAPNPAPARKVERFKLPPPLFLVKVHANSGEAAAKAVLEMLKQQGKIDDFS